MNIIVCIKQIPDPEIPPAKFKLDTKAMHVIPPEGIPPVINPYDEQATELSLRLKDKYGGKITSITLGDEETHSAIRHSLAMGADEAIILDDPAFVDSDSFSTAYILTQAIRKISDYDLILCGRQAADWDEGLVGSIIAENLGIPLITLAEEIDFNDEEFKVKRFLLDGYQIVAVPPPAVITVSNTVGKTRLPSGWGIISASRKQVPVWKASDINADSSRIGAKASQRNLIKFFSPEQERKCEIIEGQILTEASIKLAEKLKNTGSI